MIFALQIEPGYYKNGSFGIRIENVIQVVELPDSEHTFGNKGSLCFEDITMVPIQRKLMNVTMLTDEEVTPKFSSNEAFLHVAKL